MRNPEILCIALGCISVARIFETASVEACMLRLWRTGFLLWCFEVVVILLASGLVARLIVG